ncbi:unnamed protein product [Phytophthora lilii]|uniref:Unnamed protein product n=1 Tax=Phytophthora lilii TaxID=2077276 RepID=A0A9W6X5U9_9STRA|nr:unnamed protein product [Phytophthora lilii]
MPLYNAFLSLVGLLVLLAPIQALASEVYNANTASLVSDTVTDRLGGGPIARLHAKHARMLVHENVWGIMATTSVSFHGSAYANVVSYSGESVREAGISRRDSHCSDVCSLDGVGFAKEEATGTMFFYLSVDDLTGELSVAGCNRSRHIS